MESLLCSADGCGGRDQGIQLLYRGRSVLSGRCYGVQVMRFDCCKGCEDRHVGCHGVCESYLADKAENDAEKAMVQRIRAKEEDFLGFKAQTSVAIKRRFGKK